MTKEIKAIAQTGAHAITLPKRLAEKVRKACTWARGLVITDAESADVAGQALAAVVAVKKDVLGIVDPFVASAHKAHTDATARRRALTADLGGVEDYLRKTLKAWARAEAEELRRKAVAAEAKRLADQKKADEEAKRLAAEAEQEAAMAEAQGMPAPEPPPAPVPLLVPLPEPVQTGPEVATDGVGFAKKKIIVVKDEHKAIAWAVANGHWHLVKLDTVALRKLVNLVGDAVTVPGVVVEDDYSVRVGS